MMSTPIEPKPGSPHPLARVLAAAIISAFSLLVARLAFVPLYQSNDDVTMRLIAEGASICSRPTPYLLFINVILGHVMVWLHEILPILPWFTICLAAIHLAGTATVVWVGLSARRPAGWFQLLVFLTGFDIWFWVRPHFTATGAVAMIGAVVLWTYYLAKERPLAGAALAWFLALVAASSLVRWQSCGLITLASAPAILWQARSAWRRQPPRMLARSVAAPLSLAILIPVGLTELNDYIYRCNPEWSRFYEFNKVRAVFTDYEPPEYDDATRPIFDRVGLSLNDYRMLKSWAFEDRNRFSLEVLERLARELPPAKASSQWALSIQWEQSEADPSLHLVLGALLVSVLVTTRRRLVPVLLTLLWVAILGLSIAHVYQRLPPSVYEPLASLVPAIAVVGSEEREGADRIGWIRNAFAIALLCFLFGRVWVRDAAASRATAQMSDNLIKVLEEVRPRPDQLYIDWGGSFPYELLLGSRQIEALKPMRMLVLGCANQTPINAQRLREFHIDDLFRAIAQRRNIFVIGDQPDAILMSRYAEEHYGREILVRSPFYRLLGTYPEFAVLPGRSIKRGLLIYSFADNGPAAGRR